MVQKETGGGQTSATVVVRTHISTELHKELKDLAKGKGQVFSYFIREALQEKADALLGRSR